MREICGTVSAMAMLAGFKYPVQDISDQEARTRNYAMVQKMTDMFKEKTGQNFSVYLERLRMNEAARRLTSGDCNLTVLYADLGYTNPTSFRRAFKKYYGMTPSEMRDQPRRQEEKSE